jgi:hypothetical protein
MMIVPLVALGASSRPEARLVAPRASEGSATSIVYKGRRPGGQQEQRLD